MPICPKCDLDNPDSALLCDCGHPFDQAGAAAAFAAGFVPRNESHPPGPSRGAKFGFGVLGCFAGAFPLTFVAEYRSLLGYRDSGNSALRGLGVVAGIGGILVALRVLRARHESQSRRRSAAAAALRSSLNSGVIVSSNVDRTDTEPSTSGAKDSRA